MKKGDWVSTEYGEGEIVEVEEYNTFKRFGIEPSPFKGIKTAFFFDKECTKIQREEDNVQ